MTNSNDPAFPLAYSETFHLDKVGLTKREYFAAQAMKGFINAFGFTEEVPKQAIQMADALMAELNKEST